MEEENWSQLPEHLLFELISKRLSFPDLIRFGCVCKPWKAVCGPLQFPNHLPWLIVPLNNNKSTSLDFNNETGLGFFSLCDGNTYKAEIPEISDRRICGSFPGGWLMTVHHNSEIQLFNPLSRSLLNLPPLTTFPSMLHTFEQKEEGTNNVSLYYVGKRFGSTNNFTFQSNIIRDMYVRRVALSSPSVSSGTVVMTIQGLNSKLAYYKIGGEQETWTLATPETPDQKRMCFFDDVTCYKGVFYAVHNNGYVVVIKDLEAGEGTHPYAEEVIGLHPSREEFSSYSYILESSGDLLVVLRKIVLEEDQTTSLKEGQRWPYKTVGFKVLKLDFGAPNKWVEIQSLGNRSLFVGYNSSLSISSSDFSGCKPNCIYFTDHFWSYFKDQGFGGHDYGIFNLEDTSIEKLLYPSDTLMIMPPAIWFTPNPMIS